MLTKKDLDEIRAVIDERLGIKLDEKLEEKLNEKLSSYPNKDEFYEAIDQIMKELRAIRDEHAIESYRVKNHEERIASLEKIHPGGQHPS